MSLIVSMEDLGGTRGKEEGSVVSSNSVGQSTQIFETDGTDPTVVNSPKKRSWKRLPRNIAEGLPTEEVKLGKRAIILEAEEDGQNRKRGTVRFGCSTASALTAFFRLPHQDSNLVRILMREAKESREGRRRRAPKADSTCE
ncbi:hypothetical protein ACOSQ3_015867 [Xanthoceras sorbifolium]